MSLSPEVFVDGDSTNPAASETKPFNPTQLPAAKHLYSTDPSGDSSSATSSASTTVQHRRLTISIMILILILGLASASSLLALGVSNAVAQQTKQFQRAAEDLTLQIEASFSKYVQATSLIHMRCRSRNFTRTDFRELYEYLTANGDLKFEAMQFDPNVTHADRAAYEEEAREFYATNYPWVNYTGFVGFEGKEGTSPRSEHDFYFPIHYMEPIAGNEAAIDLDYYSHISRRQTLLYTLENGEPSITDRLTLVRTDAEESRCDGLLGASFGVVLMHPGIPLSTNRDVWPKDISTMVICIPQLLLSAIEGTQDVGVYVYEELYDEGDQPGEPSEYLYMGGLHAGTLEYQPEKSLRNAIRKARLEYETTIPITNKNWRVAVIALDGTYEPHVLFVVLGSVLVFLASICLSFWAWQSSQRMQAIAKLKADAEAEKAALILENARQQTSVRASS